MDELQLAFDSLTTTGLIAVDDILEAMSGTICQSAELKHNITDKRGCVLV